jgi:tight adherence protein B
MSIEIAAAGLAAAGVVTFSYGVATTWRRQALDLRMQDYLGGEQARVRARRREEERERQARAGMAKHLNQRLSRSTIGAAVQARLLRAGLAMRPSQFIVLQGLAASALALLGLLVTRATGIQAAVILLPTIVVLAGAGFAIPLLVLGHREKKRLVAFEKQLPQAIDSMAGTLQAGAALPQAMEAIGREMPPPISVEFGRVLREMELGLSLGDSLANLQNRVRSSDVLLLTSAISIQQRVGGDLAGIFRGISHTIRERLRIRGEINVLTAQGRYSAYIITALPILLFAYMWVVNPAYISQLFLPGITRVLLGGGIAGIVIGYVAMKKIVSIEV